MKRLSIIFAIVFLVIYAECAQRDFSHKKKKMYKRQEVISDQAPKPLGAYSQAILAGNLHSTVYLSGTIPINKDGKLINGTIEEQTRQVFTNMKNVAEAAGGSLDQVVKVNIFLTDLKDFSTVNQIMAEFFTKPYPARSTVGVASLLNDVKIEIDGEMRI